MAKHCVIFYRQGLGIMQMNRRLAYLLIGSIAVLALGYLIWTSVPGTSQSGDCDNMTSEACRFPARSSG